MELAQHRELIARIRVGRVSLGMWPLGALCHALAIGTVDGGRTGPGRGQWPGIGEEGVGWGLFSCQRCEMEEVREEGGRSGLRGA